MNQTILGASQFGCRARAPATPVATPLCLEQYLHSKMYVHIVLRYNPHLI